MKNALVEATPRVRGGTARRDVFGNLVPGEFNNATGQPLGENANGTPHDWTAFDKFFGPPSSQVPKPAARMASQQQAAAAGVPGPLSNPVGTVTGGAPVAVSGPGGKVTTGTSDGAGGFTVNTSPAEAADIGREYGGAIGKDGLRTANASITGNTITDAAGNTLNRQTGQVESAAQAAQPMISPDAMAALVKAYPNLAIAGHPDNQKFIKEYTGVYDPANPMGADQAMGLARGLFSPSAVPNAPMAGVGDADAAKNFGTNLVSSATPAAVPNSPLVPKPTSPSPTMPVDPTSPLTASAVKGYLGMNYGAMPASDNPANKPGGAAYTGPGNFTPTPGPRFVNNPNTGKLQPDPTFRFPSSTDGTAAGTGGSNPGGQPQTTPTTPTNPATPTNPQNPSNTDGSQLAKASGFRF